MQMYKMIVLHFHSEVSLKKTSGNSQISEGKVLSDRIYFTNTVIWKYCNGKADSFVFAVHEKHLCLG